MKRKTISHFLAALLVFAQLFTLFPAALAADGRDLFALDPPLVNILSASFTASVGCVEVTDYNNIPQNAHVK